MNIFATSSCPVESARFLDDKRVVKMILECAQLMSTALRCMDVEDDRLYKSTHVNHPCSVWVRENQSNFRWVLLHFYALCNTYSDKTEKMHKCEELSDVFEAYMERLPTGELTPFVNCAANSSLGIDFKHVDDVHKAYQHYLAERWYYDKRKPTWFYGSPLKERCPTCGAFTLTTFDHLDKEC